LMGISRDGDSLQLRRLRGRFFFLFLHTATLPCFWFWARSCSFFMSRASWLVDVPHPRRRQVRSRSASP
jgi:hypothetical protein